ncbi:MAG: deoxyguanosinetriphosphate triphosphohydrolase [Planctomycetes bacterium]|nr:deoxyguanosinetriphosphate triphosphohydrolase [Planctomycetota bacterium]
MVNREALEERELRELAPYAMKARSSRGRQHEEAEHAYRTAYQRDRDRIIHSGAFRRLEYKTQVFVNTFGDYYRTRLTHTMEVAQIARTVARALSLNEDLTEAVALAHDIGHGPFGHTGEDALAELMREHGGFEHNRQALRIVDVIERKYPGFPGLNLTAEVRESLLKHGERQLCLEAQVVDAADRIAYNTHDVDDGLTSGILDEAALSEVALWRDALDDVTRRFPGLDPARRRYHVVRSLIDRAVTDLLDRSRERLLEMSPKDPLDAQRGERLVAPSHAMERRQMELSRFLSRHFYNDYRVRRMRRKASGFIREMFLALSSDTGLLPPAAQEWAKEHGAQRGVCDYIAGMTDREAVQEYRRLFHADAGTGPE